jgi:hypothetical protein
VDISVTTRGGASATTSADRFSYAPVPVVTAVTPGAGPVGGRISVIVTGTGFVAGSAVSFGATPAASVVVTSPTSLAVTPAAAPAGTVHVTVSTPGGTSASSPADLFTYDAVPTVTGIAPSGGPVAGGTAVTVSGTDFVPGLTSVSVGGTGATGVSCSSATECSISTPPGTAGVADVIVTTPGGPSATGIPDVFSYDPVPAVSLVTPNAARR